MIKLHQFKSTFGLPNLSPPCMKLECFLKMAELPYEEIILSNPAKAPKGKGPYIEDGNVCIGDSTLIIHYLQEKHGIDLDQGLTDKQRAEALALQVMLEEHLYWVIVYSRWIDDTNWPTIRDLFFGNMPFFIRPLITNMARKSVVKALHGHGIGRHTPEEIYDFGKRDVKAVADYLGDKPFMMGDTPTLIDAAVYAVIANILAVPMESPLQSYTAKSPNLAAHSKRMQERYFPAS